MRIKNIKIKDKSLPCETLQSRSNEVAVSQGEKIKVTHMASHVQRKNN
ncbi:MAG: hypothetical protein GH151_13760 [Bacteroidetes bacterium]|nr:hypothetical protein [Bacteroidota bacterium]